MNLLDALLGPVPPAPGDTRPPEPTADDPHTGRLRRLLLDGDVQVYLFDLHPREEVALYSIPGQLPEGPWMAGQPRLWSHAVPLPADTRALSVMQIAPLSHQLFLAEVWPRAVLDPTTLGQRLDEHLTRHREWRTALERVNSERSAAWTV